MQTVFFQLALTDRNIQVRFAMKVVLICPIQLYYSKDNGKKIKIWGSPLHPKLTFYDQVGPTAGLGVVNI